MMHYCGTSFTLVGLLKAETLKSILRSSFIKLFVCTACCTLKLTITQAALSDGYSDGMVLI